MECCKTLYFISITKVKLDMIIPANKAKRLMRKWAISKASGCDVSFSGWRYLSKIIL